jgi:hypothetical protein
MAMIVTCWRMSEAEEEDDERHHRRIGVQELLDPAKRRLPLLFEDGDGGVARHDDGLVVRGPLRAARVACAHAPTPPQLSEWKESNRVRSLSLVIVDDSLFGPVREGN